MDVTYPSSFRETKSESQLLKRLLIGNIYMTTIMHLLIKTHANYVLRNDGSLTICQIYILARGLYGLLRMVQAKAPLHF